MKVCAFFLMMFFALMSQADPADPLATPETKELYRRLLEQRGHGILFGHQNTDIEGVGWSAEGDSDVHRVSGKYPAVYGYDLLELQRGLITPDEFRRRIVSAYESGSVITISWHQNNPLTGGDFRDNTPAIGDILNHGAAYQRLLSELDRIAAFLKSLVDGRGRPIPILFRPLHEGNGTWFWWGKTNRAEYLQLWTFYFQYLTRVRGLHQLLFVYSPGQLYDAGITSWLKYPGDDVVDVIGYEHYLHADLLDYEMPLFKKNIAALVFANKFHRKILAVTETGCVNAMIPPRFWTGYFLPALAREPVRSQMAFALLWQNHDTKDYFVPYPGEASADDFKNMALSPVVVFR